MPREPSTALSGTESTTLGQSIAPELEAHPSQSIFYPLPLGTEAFVARLALIRAAERSVDVQYYIVHDDETGRSLLRELLHAADRGVRVRLLVDDFHTAGEDELLAALDAHPQIEVRVFNAFHHRSARWLDFVTDFARVNRRMHNKSLTADNQATVVGGRNIGNEYFAASSSVDFSDLDLLAAGPVVPEVSAVFDEYWNSRVCDPITAWVEPPVAARVTELRAELEQSFESGRATDYARALADLQLVRSIRERRLEVTPATVHVISDPPDKVLQPPEQAAHAITELADILAAAKHELILVSPYLVPRERGARWLEEIARRGVKVRVLTNSYLSNDVTVVHAGYAVWRSRLLKAGVELYELKPDAYQRLPESSKDGTVGSSHAALHAKTYVADRETIFVGSLNLDPRSARLNTEMGLALTSDVLATRFAERFDANILDLAYHVERTADGATTWRTRENGVEVVRDSEPGVGWWQRISVFFATLLPVESQL